MDSRSRRKLLLAVYGALATFMVLGVLSGVIATIQTSDLSFSDRLVEIGDWIGAGTLLLAAFAAVVALQAYAFSTGLPDLKFKIRLTSFNPNVVFFEATTVHGGLPVIYGPTDAHMIVYNKSSYSARNPAVIVRLNNMLIYQQDFASTDPWAVVEEGGGGVTAWQWDGGSDCSIHGRSARQLPKVDFQGIRYRRGSGPPSITFELLAERYRREVTIPVDLSIDGEYMFSTGDHATPDWL